MSPRSRDEDAPAAVPGARLSRGCKLRATNYELQVSTRAPDSGTHHAYYMSIEVTRRAKRWRTERLVDVSLNADVDVDEDIDTAYAGLAAARHVRVC